MDIPGILQRVERLVTPILEGLELQLYDCEFLPGSQRAVLRLYVDAPLGGVTLDQCARASRAVEGVLDVEGEIPMPYTLEVSSPGMDRVLKRTNDFVQAIGRIVEVQTRAPQEGRSHYKGRLLEAGIDRIVLQVDRQPWTIPLDNIRKARLRCFEKD